MNHRLVRARYGYRHVLYGYAVRQSYYVNCSLYPRRILVGKSFFTSAWKQLKHGTANMGYAGSQQHQNRLPVQPVQHAVPEFWLERASIARLLRGCKTSLSPLSC